jgi:hypothetical protein
MRGHSRTRPAYTSTWDALEPWVEQLYYEHGYQTSFTIHVHAETHGLKPAVVMNLAKPVKKPGEVALYSDWEVFDPRNLGAAEGAAIRLLSKALMALDNEKWQAERKQTSLWDA